MIFVTETAGMSQTSTENGDRRLMSSSSNVIIMAVTWVLEPDNKNITRHQRSESAPVIGHS